MKLTDLKLEDFNFEEAPEEFSVLEYTDYKNGTYTVISKVAYLIGVEKKHFENDHEPPKMEWYHELSKNKNARILRNLCLLRNAIEKNYSAIYSAMSSDIKNLDSLPQYIPQEAIEELEQDGISIIKRNAKPVQYLLELNRNINNRLTYSHRLRSGLARGSSVNINFRSK